MRYFAIERNGVACDHIMVVDNDKNSTFDHYLDMDYNTMKSQKDLEEFVLAIMEATDTLLHGEDDQTIVTLIDEDDIFVWSIIMGSGEDDTVKYALVDWKKDGHSYRYEN